MTSAMNPYVFDEFTRSSASTALATVKPNTAVAWRVGSGPSGSDSVFQWARPARSLTEYAGPLPLRGRTAPSRNSSDAASRSIKWAAYSTSLAFSLRAASATALVPTEPKRLEYGPGEIDQMGVKVAISRTPGTPWGTGPSSSATIGQ